jgi:ABC-2 type transport system ATP-binding protein
VNRDLAVEAAGLRKRYGEKEALGGIDLAVPWGSVRGVLGPNGAGKTTTVRILTTLLRFDAGTARVAGHDVRRDPTGVRARIGLVGQSAAVDEVLSGRQNLALFGRLYHLDRATSARRADELLERFGLSETGAAPVSEYSGGMRRRLDLAASLILAPAVLFLDEPTAGLDPRGRTQVWRSIRELAVGGTTVVLTTQYLEEADRLADQISLIDGGRVIAEGSPDALKARLDGDYIAVVVKEADGLARAAEIVARVAVADAEVDPGRGLVSAPVRNPIGALTEVVSALGEARIEAEDIALRRPTLDEVFLDLTRDEARLEGVAA